MRIAIPHRAAAPQMRSKSARSRSGPVSVSVLMQKTNPRKEISELTVCVLEEEGPAAWKCLRALEVRRLEVWLRGDLNHRPLGYEFNTGLVAVRPASILQ